MYHYSFTSETNENKNKQEELGVIDLNPVNKYIMNIAITQPEPSLQPFTNLWGEQSYMSDLNTAHISFTNTPKDKFQDK